MLERIQKSLIVADKVCDYIPVISTVTNLVDLFQKYVILPMLDKETIRKNHYFRHIEHKLNFVAVSGLVPIFGNLYITIFKILCYFTNTFMDDKESFLEKLRRGECSIYSASKRLRDDKVTILAAVQIDGCNLSGASEDLKNDKEIVLAAVQQKEQARIFIGNQLKKDPEFILKLLKMGVRIYTLDESLLTNKKFVLEYVKLKMPWDPIPPNFQNDRDVVSKGVRHYGRNLQHASAELQNDLTICTDALLNDELAEFYIPFHLQHTAREACKNIRKREMVRSP